MLHYLHPIIIVTFSIRKLLANETILWDWGSVNQVMSLYKFSFCDFLLQWSVCLPMKIKKMPRNQILKKIST